MDLKNTLNWDTPDNSAGQKRKQKNIYTLQSKMWLPT